MLDLDSLFPPKTAQSIRSEAPDNSDSAPVRPGTFTVNTDHPGRCGSSTGAALRDVAPVAPVAPVQNVRVTSEAEAVVLGVRRLDEFRAGNEPANEEEAELLALVDAVTRHYECTEAETDEVRLLAVSDREAALASFREITSRLDLAGVALDQWRPLCPGCALLRVKLPSCHFIMEIPHAQWIAQLYDGGTLRVRALSERVS